MSPRHVLTSFAVFAVSVAAGAWREARALRCIAGRASSWEAVDRLATEIDWHAVERNGHRYYEPNQTRGPR